jgi:hypothetical protein
MIRSACTVAAAAALLAAASAEAAATRYVPCGDTPSHLRFHIEARGVSCTTGRRVGRLVDQDVKVVRTRLFEYRAGAWTCRYTVFPSRKAGDGEGEIFDCRKPGKEVRWSNARGIRPRTLWA